MKGQFGSTEYYMITMKAADVATKLVIPKEMPDWDDLDLNERFQREINYSRVRKHIAPYLANDPDRFFGALIVDVFNFEGMDFEALDQVISTARGVPGLYKSASQSFGFLTFEGGEMLVPLDGQHRLAAIKFAITGKDEKQKPIVGIDPVTDLASDDVLLILILHDPIKGRKIFNKVNRYAKATSKAENLITADDDIVAVITRDLVANELINSRLVNYSSNTLSAKAPYFTTLGTVYDATKWVLEDEDGKISDQVLPEKSKRDLYRTLAREYWSTLLEGVELYQLALKDPEETGDDKRRQIRQEFLLGKPIAQLALMMAFRRLTLSSSSDGARLPWGEIIRRINAVDWSMENNMWQKILLNGKRIVAGKQAANFAARFIAYYLGETLEKVELDNLKKLYLDSYPEDEQKHHSLPERLYQS